MSYDLRLFRPRPGVDPLETAHEDEPEPPDTPPDPAKEAVKRSVAEALMALDPTLQVFHMAFDDIARVQGISVEEARERYRHIELNGPEDDEAGIQVTLYDDEATVTVPYWHRGEAAQKVFRKIWQYLEVIWRLCGYVVYDPQLDRVFDPPAELDAAIAAYTGVSENLETIVTGKATPPKPWWKFW